MAILATLRRHWCALVHPAGYPISGKYTCVRCLCEFPVEWGAEAQQ